MYRNENSGKSSIVTTVVVFLVCLVLITGSTFSLFTSKTGTNIAVTSGNVEMVATIDASTLALYSKGIAQTDKFANGGTAAFNDAKTELTLTNITPGDSVEFNIVLENKSTVDLQYRVNWIVTGDLAEALTATVGGADITSGTSEWTLWKADAAEMSQTLSISIELPLEADDNWESLEANIAFNVEAVQANATGEYSPVAFVSSAAGLQAALDAGCTEIHLNSDITLDESLVIPAAPTTYSLRSATKVVTLNLNGKTISGNVGRDADDNRVHVIVNNGNAVIKNGVITSAGVNGGSAIYNADGATLTVENVTLNGAPQEGSTWPSYTVNNFGTLTVSDSSIYGVQGIIATNNTANTTVNNVIAYRDGWSSGHVFYTSSTAKVTINGGTYTNDGNGVDGTMFYGGETVVNGGTFIVKEGAYFALCSGSKLTVNGGDFSNIKSCLAWGGAMTISGGTFGFNPTTYVAEGYKAVENADGTYSVIFPQESVDSLLENAVAGDTVELPAGTYTFPSDKLQAGVTLNCAPGTVFEGTSTLNINGATVVGGTFSNASGNVITSTINGTFKDCTFTGKNALRWCYAGENVVFENCVFDGSVYGVHFDGGANEVIFRDCTFSGFNAFGGSITNLVLDGCTFKSNGKSGYNGANLWGSTELIDCTFVFDGSVGYEWVDALGDNKTYSFTNCVVTDGENTKGVETVAYNFGTGNTITIDGVPFVVSSDDLTATIVAGAEKVLLAAGEYVMPDGSDLSLRGKTLTIIGDENTVIDVSGIDERDQFVTGATLVFEGVTLNFGTANYMGFANATELVYRDCTINGLQFLYGPSVTFENCVLNSNGAEHCVWTWGVQNVSFTDCDFTYGDRAVNCYGEGVTTNASFTNCTFTKVEGKDTTGAIETNSSTLTALNLTIENCTVNEGDLWWVSVWDGKNGANTNATVK